MHSASAPGVLALLFILAMAWFRTRLRYPHAPGTRLRLTRAGVGYFLVLLLVLLAGWFVAPRLVQHFGLAAVLSAAFARVAWFLVVYLAFIPLHRAFIARGARVFAIQAAGTGSQGG